MDSCGLQCWMPRLMIPRKGSRKSASGDEIGGHKSDHIKKGSWHGCKCIKSYLRRIITRFGSLIRLRSLSGKVRPGGYCVTRSPLPLSPVVLVVCDPVRQTYNYRHPLKPIIWLRSFAEQKTTIPELELSQSPTVTQ